MRGFKPPPITKEASLKALQEVKNVMEIHEEMKCQEPYVQAMVCMKNALTCSEAFLHYHNIHKFSPKEVLEAFEKEFSDFTNLRYLEDCYWAKVHWPEIMHDNDRLLSLAEKSKAFIQTVFRFMKI